MSILIGQLSIEFQTRHEVKSICHVLAANDKICRIIIAIKLWGYPQSSTGGHRNRVSPSFPSEQIHDDKQFHTIYGHSFIRTKDDDNIRSKEKKEKFNRIWENFLKGDLEKIKMIFQAQPWI